MSYFLKEVTAQEDPQLHASSERDRRDVAHCSLFHYFADVCVLATRRKGFLQLVDVTTGAYQTYLTHLDGGAIPLEAPLRFVAMSPALYVAHREAHHVFYALAHSNELLCANFTTGHVAVIASFSARPSAAHSDGEFVACGTADGQVHLWRATTLLFEGATVHTRPKGVDMSIERSAIAMGVFSGADEGYGGGSGAATDRDVSLRPGMIVNDSGSSIWRRKVHRAGISAVAIVRDVVVIAADDFSVAVMGVHGRGEHVARLAHHASRVRGVAGLSPLSLALCLAADDGALSCFAPSRAAVQRSRPVLSAAEKTAPMAEWALRGVYRARAGATCVSYRNGYLVVGTADGCVEVFDAEDDVFDGREGQALDQEGRFEPATVAVMDVGGPVVGAEILADDHLVVVTAGGDVWRWPMQEVRALGQAPAEADTHHDDVHTHPYDHQGHAVVDEHEDGPAQAAAGSSDEDADGPRAHRHKPPTPLPHSTPSRTSASIDTTGTGTAGRDASSEPRHHSHSHNQQHQHGNDHSSASDRDERDQGSHDGGDGEAPFAFDDDAEDFDDDGRGTAPSAIGHTDAGRTERSLSHPAASTVDRGDLHTDGAVSTADRDGDDTEDQDQDGSHPLRVAARQAALNSSRVRHAAATVPAVVIPGLLTGRRLDPRRVAYGQSVAGMLEAGDAADGGASPSPLAAADPRPLPSVDPTANTSPSAVAEYRREHAAAVSALHAKHAIPAVRFGLHDRVFGAVPALAAPLALEGHSDSSVLVGRAGALLPAAEARVEGPALLTAAATSPSYDPRKYAANASKTRGASPPRPSTAVTVAVPTAAGGAADDLVDATFLRFARRQDEAFLRQRAVEGPDISAHGCADLLFGSGPVPSALLSLPVPTGPLLTSPKGGGGGGAASALGPLRDVTATSTALQNTRHRPSAVTGPTGRHGTTAQCPPHPPHYHASTTTAKAPRTVFFPEPAPSADPAAAGRHGQASLFGAGPFSDYFIQGLPLAPS